jgi:excisionase family DNA binding protein
MPDTSTVSAIAETDKPRKRGKLLRERVTGAAYTTSEVAARLRVGEDKIRTAIANGELKAVDLAARGSKRPRWRISPEDLEAFLAARASGGSKPAPRPAPRRTLKSSGKQWF